MTPVGLKLFFFTRWREARTYFTGRSFKKENLYLDCLEERDEVEDGLRNLSKLISDYPIYIFLLKAWFSAPEPVNTSASRGVLGTVFGPWAGSPRPNCVPLGLLF